MIRGDHVYQVSIRFCPNGSSPPEDCTFPNRDWVDENWDAKSAAFYCFSGPCRSHADEEVTHAGYCLNC
jgi:hypothetical protein